MTKIVYGVYPDGTDYYFCVDVLNKYDRSVMVRMTVGKRTTLDVWRWGDGEFKLGAELKKWFRMALENADGIREQQCRRDSLYLFGSEEALNIIAEKYLGEKYD